MDWLLYILSFASLFPFLKYIPIKSIDLGAERFSKLENPLQNWDEAMSLLGGLLVLSSGVLFCVIKALVDYGRGRTLFRDVLSLMRRYQVSSRQNGLVFLYDKKLLKSVRWRGNCG